MIKNEPVMREEVLNRMSRDLIESCIQLKPSMEEFASFLCRNLIEFAVRLGLDREEFRTVFGGLLSDFDRAKKKAER